MWLYRLRERLGLSQEEMAALLGVSRPMVSAIENGKRVLSGRKALEARDSFKSDLLALGVTLEEMLTEGC